MDDQELLKDFRLEALENLQVVEDQLLALENGEEEAIHAVFRSMHSIKGNSSFFDLVSINTLAHRLEHLLDSVRDEELSLCSDICDLLLRGSDQLRSLLDHLDEPSYAAEAVALLVHQIEQQLVDTSHAQPKTNNRLRKHSEDGPAAVDEEAAETAKVTSGVDEVVHLAGYLSNATDLTEAQLLEALIAQAQTEPSAMQMLQQEGGLTAAQLIQVADLATARELDHYTSAAELGLVERREVLLLRHKARRSRAPLGKVIVELGFADRSQVKQWMHDFLHPRSADEVSS